MDGKTIYKSNVTGNRGVTQVSEHMPGMCEALGSSTTHELMASSIV